MDVSKIHAETRAEIQKRVADEPIKGRVYMHLIHGRDEPNVDMDDWGYDGPFIGPLKYCHITYLSTISLGFLDGFETDVLLHKSEGLCFHEDLIYFQNAYYGDWEICVA